MCDRFNHCVSIKLRNIIIKRYKLSFFILSIIISYLLISYVVIDFICYKVYLYDLKKVFAVPNKMQDLYVIVIIIISLRDSECPYKHRQRTTIYTSRVQKMDFKTDPSGVKIHLLFASVSIDAEKWHQTWRKNDASSQGVNGLGKRRIFHSVWGQQTGLAFYEILNFSATTNNGRTYCTSYYFIRQGGITAKVT